MSIYGIFMGSVGLSVWYFWLFCVVVEFSVGFFWGIM